jgi:hypothetical protein
MTCCKKLEAWTKFGMYKKTEDGLTARAFHHAYPRDESFDPVEHIGAVGLDPVIVYKGFEGGFEDIKIYKCPYCRTEL